MPQDLHTAITRCGWLGRSFGYQAVIASLTDKALPVPPRISVILAATQPNARVFAHLKMMADSSQHPFRLVVVEQEACASPAVCGDIAHTHIRLRGEAGLHTARNIGALFAEGPILVFLSDAFYPLPDILDKYLACFEEHKPLAVRGVVKNVEQVSMPVGAFFRTTQSEPWIVDIDENLAVEANAFYALGGFDESLPEGCGAIDISIRLYERCSDLTRQRYQADAAVVADASFDPQMRYARCQQAWHSLNKKYGQVLMYYSIVAESLCGIQEEKRDE